MSDYEPTVRSRELGEGLRQLLENAGFNGKEVSEELGWSQSDVSRMLTGRKPVSEGEVLLLLGLCRAKPPEVRRFKKLCAEAARLGWFQQHGSRLPVKLTTYLAHEAQATKIIDCANVLVPGVLQTKDYARGVISKFVNVPADEVEERVEARLARASIYDRSRSSAAFTYFLPESALRVPVGDAQVMSEQLHHLLRMSVRPYLQLRVIPNSAGVHEGMEGSFTLMEFAKMGSVVYLENATTTVFLEEPEELATYKKIADALAVTALSPEESRELISALAVELFGD